MMHPYIIQYSCNRDITTTFRLQYSSSHIMTAFNPIARWLYDSSITLTNPILTASQIFTTPTVLDRTRAQCHRSSPTSTSHVGRDPVEKLYGADRWLFILPSVLAATEASRLQYHHPTGVAEQTPPIVVGATRVCQMGRAAEMLGCRHRPREASRSLGMVGIQRWLGQPTASTH